MSSSSDVTARQRPLMEATLRLIGRSGLDGVTHRAVAAEAATSLGAITHHFKSRDALIEAALRHALARETGRLRALSLSLQDKSLDVDAWLDSLVTWYDRELRTEAEMHVACYEAFLTAARTPRYRPIVEEWFQTWQASARLIFATAGSRDPQGHAELFVSALIGLVLKQLAAPRRIFRREARATLSELVARLLART